MPEAKKRLLVLDVAGTLSPGFLERLGRECTAVQSRSVEDLRNRLADGAWQGVLIVVDGAPTAALALAAHAKRVNPGIAVILLGALRAPQSAHDAFRAGVDAIVDPDDFAALYDAVVTRLSPAMVAS